MKAATGELNLTVITVAAVAAVVAFFTWVLWPNISKSINKQWENVENNGPTPSSASEGSTAGTPGS